MHDHQESRGNGLVICLFLVCAGFVAIAGTGILAPLH